MSEEGKTKVEQLAEVQAELEREIAKDRGANRSRALNEVCERLGLGKFENDPDESYRMARLVEIVDKAVTELTAVRAAVGIAEEG